MAKKKKTEQNKPVVEQKRVCRRCGGDGFWHSTKTGVRAETSAEPLVDTSRKCPICKKDE